jgi:hypothetical protein
MYKSEFTSFPWTSSFLYIRNTADLHPTSCGMAHEQNPVLIHERHPEIWYTRLFRSWLEDVMAPCRHTSEL